MDGEVRVKCGGGGAAALVFGSKCRLMGCVRESVEGVVEVVGTGQFEEVDGMALGGKRSELEVLTEETCHKSEGGTSE